MARLSDLVLSAQLEMAATPEQVWEGLTNPQLTRRYYFGLAIDTDLRPGTEYAYRGTDGEAAQSGTVLEAEPPRRLRLSSRLLFSPEFRDDPPHRITWEVEPVTGDRSLVGVTVDGFESETTTYRLYAQNEGVLTNLRALRSEEHTSELQSLRHLVCRLLLEKKNKNHYSSPSGRWSIVLLISSWGSTL